MLVFGIDYLKVYLVLYILICMVINSTQLSFEIYQNSSQTFAKIVFVLHLNGLR